MQFISNSKILSLSMITYTCQDIIQIALRRLPGGGAIKKRFVLLLYCPGNSGGESGE
jgi:hypothetical protein